MTLYDDTTVPASCYKGSLWQGSTHYQVTTPVCKGSIYVDMSSLVLVVYLVNQRKTNLYDIIS